MAYRHSRATPVRELPQPPSPAVQSGDPAPERQDVTGPRARDGRPGAAWWALTGYLAVLAVVAWPLVTGLRSTMQGLGDAGSFMWGFWWLREALATGQNPFVTDMMFAPVGTPLAFHTGMPLIAAASIPLQALTGTVVAYHLIVLATPVCSAMAAYALARDLRQPPAAAFVAGATFGFAPALIDRLAIEHLNLAVVAWLPLGLLALRRALDHPSATRAALLGVVLAGALWTDLTVLVFTVLVVAAYLAGWVWRRWRMRQAWGADVLRLWPAVLVAGALAAPLLIAMARVMLAGEYPEVPGLGGSTSYSADVASFALPSPRHRWLGALVTPAYAVLQGRPLDGAATLSVVAVALSVAGLWAARARPVVRWAALLSLAGMALALGPQLHAFGRTAAPLGLGTADEGPISALLPFSWIQVVPVLEGLRSPVRFLTLTALGLALLAGFGFARLTAARPRGATVAAAVLVATLIAAESASSFPTLTSSHRPKVYDVIAADPSDALVVNVPLGFRSGVGNVGRQEGPPLVWATHHGHPVAVGFGARTPVPRLEALADQPLYRDLLALQTLSADPAARADPVAGRANALAIGARYVVVSGAEPQVEAFLAAVGYIPIERDGSVAVYVLEEAGAPRR